MSKAHGEVVSHYTLFPHEYRNYGFLGVLAGARPPLSPQRGVIRIRLCRKDWSEYAKRGAIGVDGIRAYVVA